MSHFQADASETWGKSPCKARMEAPKPAIRRNEDQKAIPGDVDRKDKSLPPGLQVAVIGRDESDGIYGVGIFIPTIPIYH